MTNTPTPTQPRNYVQPLEDALNYWEDKLCTFDAMARTLRKKPDAKFQMTDPAIKNWQDFRQIVLGSKFVEHSNHFNLRQAIKLDLVSFREEMVPLLIWMWNSDSRRIFHVNSDLDLELRTTNLGDITWNDIRMPFRSFLVTLDEPIGIPGENYKSQTIMCTFIPEGTDSSLPHGVLSLSLWPSLPNGYRPMNKGRRDQLLRAAKNGNMHLAKKMTEECYEYWKSCQTLPVISIFQCSWDDIGNRKVTDSLMDAFKAATEKHPTRFFKPEGLDKGAADLELAVRIVVGMVAHLQSLSPEESVKAVSKWQSLRTNSIDESAIFSEAEICTVGSIAKLTNEERGELQTILRESKGGYELSAHMRAGYHRRRPGQGNDPSAPKSVWVKPAEVRFDRIRGLAALPKGSESHV